MEKAYLLLRREIVDDIEKFANLFGSLTLDHICHGLASNVPIQTWSADTPTQT
jgi:hypothetical protein